MRKDFKPNTWLYPQPVMVIATYDEKGIPNAMVAAWGGIYDSNKVGFMLSSTHKTTENLKKKKAFTVSTATEKTMAEADFLGMVSGYDVPDKVSRAGLSWVESSHVAAPVLLEFPLTLECSVTDIVPVGEDFYFIGEIRNITADESVLDEKGMVQGDKLQALVFDPIHHGYRTVGPLVGHMLSEGKKYRK